MRKGSIVILSTMVILLILLSGSIPGEGYDIPDTGRSENTRTSGDPYQLLWEVQAVTGSDTRMSSPSITDLDNDGTMEIVALSESRGVICLDHNSQVHSLPDQEIVTIEDPKSSGYYQDPDLHSTDGFPSVLTADIRGTSRPEIVYGGPGGLYCLDNTGKMLFEPTDRSDGMVFSTPCLTDLEGEWSGIQGDREMVYLRDLENGTVLLEGCDMTGRKLFSFPLDNGSNGAAVAVASEDLDGDFWSGPDMREPDSEDEREPEILLSIKDSPLSSCNIRSIGDQYHLNRKMMAPEERSYSGSPAVGNVDQDRELEALVLTTTEYLDPYPFFISRIICVDLNGNLEWERELISQEDPYSTSPVIADLSGNFHGTGSGWDKGIEVIVTAGEYLYVINGDTGFVRSSFKAGAMITSDPVVADLDGNGELEILVLDNDGILYVFDGDPTDDVDEGEKYPGDDSYRDLLWTDSGGHPGGFSTPAVCDIDRDGRTDMVICYDDGTVRVLSMKAQRPPNPGDWITCRGDTNRTGWYHYPRSLDFEMVPLPGIDGDGTHATSPPENTVEFILYLTDKTLGPLPQGGYVVDLSIRKDLQQFPCSIRMYLKDGETISETTGMIPLGKGSNKTIIIKADIPANADHGDGISFHLEGIISGEGGLNKELSYSIDVAINVDIGVEFELETMDDPENPLKDIPFFETPSNKSRMIMLKLENRGDVEDHLTLHISDPEGDWNWYFNESGNRRIERYLGPRDRPSDLPWTSYVPIMVESGKVLPYPLSVRIGFQLTSDMREEILPDSPAIEAEVLVMAVDRYVLDAELDEDELTGPPGSQVETTLEIGYKGTQDEVTISTHVSANSLGWSVHLDPSPSISVGSGSEISVEVAVFIPETATADDECLIEIFLDILEGDGDTTILLRVSSELEHDLMISLLDPVPTSIDPGGETAIRIYVTNDANCVNNIDFEFDEGEVPLNLKLTDREGAEIHGLTLPPRQVEMVLLHLSAQDDAGAGRVDTWIGFVDDLGEREIVRLELDISVMGDLEIGMIGGDNRLFLAPGSIGESQIMITNKGNGRETFRFQLGTNYDPVEDMMSPLPGGWWGGFTAVSRSIYTIGNRTIFPGEDPLKIDDWSATQLLVFGHGRNFPKGTLRTYVQEIELVLDRGESACLVLTILSPHNNGVSRIDGTIFRIQTGSDISGMKSTIQVEPRILYPDLEISGYALKTTSGDVISRDVREGKFELNLTVSNTGDISSDGFEARFEINGIFQEMKEIGSLGPGESINLSFPSELKRGRCVLKVVLDPENEIFESRDQFMNEGSEDNNHLIYALDVRENERGLTFPYMILLIIVTAMITIIIIVLLVSRVSGRNRKPGEGRKTEVPSGNHPLSIDDREKRDLEDLMKRLGGG